MKRDTQLRLLVTTALLIPCLMAVAEERGYWRAASSSARSVTGDIAVGDEKLTINFYTTPISRIRAIDASEVSAVFDTDSNTAGTGSLYRLDIPAEKKFQHKNSLCGSESTQWMVAYASGNTLQIAFFSGAKPPTLTFDAISSSTDKCGTFTYAR